MRDFFYTKVARTFARLVRPLVRATSSTTKVSALPPCYTVFKLHCLNPNAVAAAWKRANHAIINMPCLSGLGWLGNGDTLWVRDIFLEDMKDILLHPMYDPSGDYNVDSDTSDDET